MTTQDRNHEPHDAPDDDAANAHAECYACPVGGFFARLEDVAGQSDAVDHLLAAAHELLQAARTVIDAADGVVEEQRKAREARSAGTPRLRRIDVD